MTYPKDPGYTDEGTSKEAAASMADAAPFIRQKVLLLLGQRPMTGWEVADTLGLLLHSAGPRLTELKLAGLVRKSAERRISPLTGRPGAVWELCPPPRPVNNPQGVNQHTRAAAGRAAKQPDLFE
jgi:hypothetical protein